MTDRLSPVLRPEHPLARALGGLVEEFSLESVGLLDGVEVTGVTVSTNDVQPGDLFVGLPGQRRHGAEFAAEARERGAVAMMTDPEGARLAVDTGLPTVIVESARLALGDVSAWVYQSADHPPLLFGITGTDGKTSTAYLLESILRQLGLAAGLSTTVEQHIGDLTVVSEITALEASELHALLARMKESEVRAAAIAVSAQALRQHRVDGILFDVVSFTNLSPDHLEDDVDPDEYFAAKLSLFEPEHGRRGVVSLDTSWGKRIVEGSHIPVTTISAKLDTDAEWRVDILDEYAEYTAFRLSGPEGRSLESTVPVIGWHMGANAGLAIVMLVEAGFELEAIGHAIQDGIDAYLPGRTERVSGDGGPALYVDFAHTPEALLNTLGAVRKVTTGRIILVLGASGDRDVSKRLHMGRIASEHSDVLIVTDHHPRFENADSIRKILVEGALLATAHTEIHEVSAPELAIRKAVSLARDGDSILWAGPGHQDFREIKGIRMPYSARAEARAALREAGW